MPFSSPPSSGGSGLPTDGSGTMTGAILLAGITPEPAIPAADRLAFYAENVGGRMLPKWVGPSGVDTAFQTGLAFNNVSLLSPGGGTTISVLGCTVTSVGTVSNPTPASTNYKTQARRFAILSAISPSSVASIRVPMLECWRGNAAGFGGFFVSARFSLDIAVADARAFIGLADDISAPTNVDPKTSTTLGKVGMAITDGVSTWSLVNNITGTAPTVLDLGVNFPIDTTTLYEMILFAAPNGSDISYRITNLTTAVTLTGTLTTNIPASATFLARQAWMSNNGTLSPVQFSVNRFYLESDT